jgi:hypothetical protein
MKHAHDLTCMKSDATNSTVTHFQLAISSSKHHLHGCSSLYDLTMSHLMLPYGKGASRVSVLLASD